MHFNRFQFNHGCVLWSRVSNSVEGDYVMKTFSLKVEKAYLN
jgi:hypothetical protein